MKETRENVQSKESSIFSFYGLLRPRTRGVPKKIDDRRTYNFVILNLSMSANNPLCFIKRTSVRILAAHINSVS